MSTPVTPRATAHPLASVFRRGDIITIETLQGDTFPVRVQHIHEAGIQGLLLEEDWTNSQAYLPVSDPLSAVWLWSSISAVYREAAHADYETSYGPASMTDWTALAAKADAR